MHSKAHFKSLCNSPKISTVQVKNIFFLNTTLPKEHSQIYFTIFGASKSKIQKLQKTCEICIQTELDLKHGVADRWDLRVSWTHMSSRQNRADGATLRTRPDLVAGEFPGEITGTIVIYYPRRVEWSRW